MPVYEGDLAGHCIYTHALLTTAPMFPGKPTSTAEAQFLKGMAALPCPSLPRPRDGRGLANMRSLKLKLQTPPRTSESLSYRGSLAPYRCHSDHQCRLLHGL